MIGFANTTQIIPMMIREPVLLLPLLGAMIPIAIQVGGLIALSKKSTIVRPPQGS